MKPLTLHCAIYLVIVALLIQITGCSTVATPRQNLSFTSTPSGARVTVNGEEAGVTPTIYSVKRNQESAIIVTKEGYEPATRSTSRALSTFGILDVVGGCIILLPFFGLLAPGAWEQDPSNFAIVLSPKEDSAPRK